MLANKMEDDHKKQNIEGEENNNKQVNHFVFGRITGLTGESTSLKDYHVEVRLGNDRLAETFTDNSGHFLLTWPRRNTDENTIINVVILTPGGKTLGYVQLYSKDLVSPKELIIHSPLTITDEDSSFVNVPPLQHNREPLVSVETLKRLYAVVISAIDGGYLMPEHGVFSETAWIHTTITELEQFEYLALGVIQGDLQSISGVMDLIRGAPRWKISWSNSLPDPGRGPIPGCLLEPIPPSLVGRMGLLLDRLHSQEAGNPWLEQAIGFYLSKSAPIRSVFFAVERVFKEEMSIQEFAEFFNSARHSSLSHEHRLNFTSNNLHDGHNNMVPDDDFLLDSGFPFSPRKWDPCTITWGRCTGILSNDLANSYRPPGSVFRVQPRAVCNSYGGTLTLYPVFQFPTPQPQFGPNEGFVLSVDSKIYPLSVISGGWTAASVTVNFPQGVVPGCGQIYLISPMPSTSSGGSGNIENDCNNLLGITPEKAGMLGRLTEIGSSRGSPTIAIGGTPTIKFTANGETNLVAEACTNVELRWEVSAAGICQKSSIGQPTPELPNPASAKVTLSNGSQVLIANAPLKGSYIVKERNKVTYTLSVVSSDGSTTCGTATANETIDRINRIFLSAPERVFYPNRRIVGPGNTDTTIPASIPIKIRLNCAAPTGGVPINIASSDPVTLTGGSIVVPANAAETTIELTPSGNQFNTVHLTATSNGFVQDTLEILVNSTSCIPGLPQWGGKWDLGPDLSSLGVVGVHIAVLHTGKVILFNYNEGPSPSNLVITAYHISRSNEAKCAIWDPKLGIGNNSIKSIPLNRNLFCSGHCFLPDGRLFVAGGQFSVPFYWPTGLAELGSTIGLLPPGIGVAAFLASAIAYDAGAAHDLHVFDPVSEQWTRIQP